MDAMVKHHWSTVAKEEMERKDTTTGEDDDGNRWRGVVWSPWPPSDPTPPTPAPMHAASILLGCSSPIAAAGHLNMLAAWNDRDIIRARDCPRSYVQAVPASCTVQAVKMFGCMQAYRLLSNRFTFD
jgi:hypothetical protein